MVYFFGNTPQGLLFEPINSTSFKFDGVTINSTAQDSVNLAEFIAILRNEIENVHIYQSRELQIVDVNNNLTLGLYARYNATMHIELLSTDNQQRISPLYCVCSDLNLIELLETLLQ